MLIPSLPEPLTVINHEFAHPGQLGCVKAHRLGQRNRLQPECRVLLCRLHMNMGWLMAFVAEEKEALRPYAGDRRHDPLYHNPTPMWAQERIDVLGEYLTTGADVK